MVCGQLQDPSFEQGNVHWQFTCPDDGFFTGTTAPGGGTYCAQVTAVSSTQPDCYYQSGTLPFVYQELTGAQNGDLISITFWHRGTPTPPTLMGSLGLLVVFGWWDPPLVAYQNSSCAFNWYGTYETWEPITISCTLSDLPPGATAAIFLGGQATNHGNGMVQFDLASVTVTSPSVTLAADAFLDGPYDTDTGLMSNELRTAGQIPLSEPYSALYGGTGGETVIPAVLSVAGANAIVDWVRLELRTGTASNTTVAVRHALIQRDGDIVDTDGISPVVFDVPPGSYRVVLRHRNHLGVMTASPVTLSSTPSSIDFTNPVTATHGTNAQRNISGTMVLWPGDANFDGTAIYTGTGNDRDLILTAIGGTTPTNTVTNTYSPFDINMDGTIRYTGTNNDRDIILQTIGGVVPTATRIEQLP